MSISGWDEVLVEFCFFNGRHARRLIIAETKVWGRLPNVVTLSQLEKLEPKICSTTNSSNCRFVPPKGSYGNNSRPDICELVSLMRSFSKDGYTPPGVTITADKSSSENFPRLNFHLILNWCSLLGLSSEREGWNHHASVLCERWQFSRALRRCIMIDTRAVREYNVSDRCLTSMAN